jgi:GNAT superfamily N-acetyltransferase
MATIETFGPEHVAAAAELLARRHARHRSAEPLLAKQFSLPENARAEVQALLDAGATGTVAASGDTVTGYLLGLRKSETWGPNVWVEAAGHAVDDAETARDLYAAAAQQWHDEGRTAHYALLPAHDAGLVDAWFRLGFGLQHAHAVSEVPESPAPPRAGVVVRRARRADIPVLAQLDVELPLHQGRSPVFSAGHVPTLAAARAEWEEDIDNAEFTHFVAEVDGRVVGAATGCALEKSSSHQPLTRPDHAGFLGFASVLPEARGHGAGRALGEAVLGWTAEAGFTSAATDWRVTNLLSSRTWPRLGFRPTFLRLHRNLGF